MCTFRNIAYAYNIRKKGSTDKNHGQRTMVEKRKKEPDSLTW